MNHWIILPILLPALVAPLIALIARHDIVLARTFSVGATVLSLGLALMLAGIASEGEPQVYLLGNWVAPFGIVLVLDRLSALMLTLTAVLGLAVLLYAINGWDRRGPHFHSLFQFQLMGINGAFLTGDLFNLFVFFEVLLIASYGLMVHGGGALRIKAGVQYVIVNLLGSTLFLIAVGLIYSVTGTLNMADLAQRVAQAAPADQGLLHAGALLLLLVFGIKAALVPVQFWLPGTYAHAPAPVAALFAIMTKVGAYSIIRVYTLMFGASGETDVALATPWLLPTALVTLVLGMLGVVAARSLGQLVSFAVIASMGTLLAAVALFTPASVSAALYYLVHSTLAAGVLFLIVDMIGERRPGHADNLTVAPVFAHGGMIAALFFLGAIAMAGMPPLSGFVGKLLILDGVRGHASANWIWATVLGASLLGLLGFARAGSTLFWKSTSVEGAFAATGGRAPILQFVTIGALLMALVLITIFAGALTNYVDHTAAQLFDPQRYIDAVFGQTKTGVR